MYQCSIDGCKKEIETDGVHSSLALGLWFQIAGHPISVNMGLLGLGDPGPATEAEQKTRAGIGRVRDNLPNDYRENLLFLKD